jgi:hypothetical protein
MTHTTTRPRLVARAVTLALWAVGSAYLLRHEWQAASPDWVIICATPVVWAVILALPVLSVYARHDRQWIATALLWLAALVGSAYTLNATIGRQSASRDAAVMSAEAVAKQRDVLTVALDAEKLRRADALAKCGAGRLCHDSTRSLIGMHQLEVERLERQIAGLTLAAPQAGEQRVAALLAMLTGLDLTFAADLVGLLAPCLLGLTLELSAFAAAMYGWHPCRQRLPEPANGAGKPANGAGKPANGAGKPAKPATHPVIEALTRAGRPLSNGELARLMGVCDGEATKRRREVANVIHTVRHGRHVMVSL